MLSTLSLTQMTRRPDYSCKAMRVPKKSKPEAEIRTLNADSFIDWFNAAEIRALNENRHDLFKELKDTRGPTFGFKCEAPWERWTKKRIMKVGVLRGSLGDSPREEGATRLRSASDDASFSSTSLGIPSRAASRDFLRETATRDTAPERIHGSVFGWLRRFCFKVFIPNQTKAQRVGNWIWSLDISQARVRSV